MAAAKSGGGGRGVKVAMVGVCGAFRFSFSTLIADV